MNAVAATCIAVTALILSGCAVRNLTYGNPPVVFAYPETIPIIKDAAKVATIVTRGDVFIEGANFPGMWFHRGNSMRKQTIDTDVVPRVSNDSKQKESIVVDVLPGVYTIIKTYTAGGSENAEIELEAGHIYWVTIKSGKMLIEKDELTNIHFFTDAAPDKSFPDFLKNQIVKSRNAAK